MIWRAVAAASLATRCFGAWMPPLRGCGGSARKAPRSLTAAIDRGHAAQVPCRAPSPYSQGPVPGAQLAGLRGRAAPAWVVDDLVHGRCHRSLARGGADHAGRAGALLAPGDRNILDAAGRVRSGAAPDRGAGRLDPGAD